ncbi:MAG: hypothetical protein ACRD6I_06835, partial [Candidatus Acidiferrales bacterium]
MLCLAGSLSLRAQSSGEARSIPAPQFSPGMILRYQFDVRSEHEGDVTGAIADPQGGNRVSIGFAAVFK